MITISWYFSSGIFNAKIKYVINDIFTPEKKLRNNNNNITCKFGFIICDINDQAAFIKKRT